MDAVASRDAGLEFQPAISPDGREVAAVTADRKVVFNVEIKLIVYLGEFYVLVNHRLFGFYKDCSSPQNFI